ncbi:cytosine-purine permease [Ophiostoma piceae UAMH 11346]|uniref:Cytosine-purine permease n=1 Tax=Ophiostoma piceae (strain UAMH 11346) TaxID=1262450 RepID=S3CQT7_OPHP1|nr:cytosine-purine permease [Ophiostoma piceae UAMH 11346]
MKSTKSSWSQGIWFPLICSWVAIMGIVATSASNVVYGTLIWNPVSIVATWDGDGGRAAAFFAGVSWCIAQMGVNISATVISGANDLTSLFPKYVNIRRGVLIQAFISGWVMVPWKIIRSADSLLNFLNSLGIFLGPIMVCCLRLRYYIYLLTTKAIQITDFFIVKRRKLDVPDLYDPHGRYRYWYGINWRALAAMIIAIGPMLPGLINAVNSNISTGGAVYISDLNLYFGIIASGTLYTGLSLLFPAHETSVSELIETTEGVVEEAALGALNEKEKEKI